MANIGNASIRLMLKRLWRHLSKRRRQQFLLLLVLMIIASFAEILSIGAVLPFLATLTAPESVMSNPLAQPFIKMLSINEASELLLPMTVIFSVSTLLAATIRLSMIWANTRLSFAAGADVSLDIYRRTLQQPYRVHISRNSSEIIDGITFKSNSMIYNAILPTLNMISASIMLTVILAALVYMNPAMATSAFLGFGVIYLVIIRLTKTTQKKDSENIAHESVQVIKALQEGLGGIRDVLLDASQNIYCKIYQKSDKSLRRAQGNNYFISQSPRYGMEALGMILIAGLAYYLTQQSDGIQTAIPLLGAFALGAQKLLPILQQVYSSWSSLRGGQAALRETLALLDQPVDLNLTQPNERLIEFNDSLSFSNASFRYEGESEYVLNNLNFSIKKGYQVGFIGTTGSGKSTLLDLVMGLLDPTEGNFKVDDIVISSKNKRSWQRRVAHVPQSIYLSDTSVAQNIAFGVDHTDIDYERVKDAAKRAQVDTVIEALPKQYNTFIGERGVRLSGGQRQRIGIARALYKNADVIIFDEATSALDSDTEEAVMNAINHLGGELTILIIAHRLSTLKKCNLIIKLENGNVVGSGAYQNMTS